ncbi:hypothetical protein [Vibrio xiamenensis]|nr:hypothetical protein [Vibrio xiamenensis]
MTQNIQSAAGSDSIAYNSLASSIDEDGLLSVPAWSVAVFEKPHQ